jgi:phosphatidylserine decarboxylase
MQIKYIDRKTKEIINETPPGESFLKFLYHNPFGKMALHSLVKRKFLSELYGRQMDNPKSKKMIAPFVEQYDINLDECVKSLDEFESFNDFFYRKLRPGIRKIDNGIVSPADGKLIAFEDISEVSKFFVKGSEFTIESFLGDERLAEKYKDSSMFVVRLAPNDYHRFHFPYAGTPSDIKKINGSYFSVSPYAVNENFAKVFCENKREYTILKTEDKGNVVLAPVGATMVGAIIETFSPNQKIGKADEMGYFAFGGSSILMLVDKDKINIDKDLLENTRNGMETFIRMGERIGR